MNIDLCKNCNNPIDRVVEDFEYKQQLASNYEHGKSIRNAINRKLFRSVDLCNFCYTSLRVYIASTRNKPATDTFEGEYTTQTKPVSDYIKFADIVESAKMLKACPIQEIRVGMDFYESLLTTAKKDINKPKDVKMYLGSLYGVKIVIDPELKKDQYKIIQNEANL